MTPTSASRSSCGAAGSWRKLRGGPRVAAGGGLGLVLGLGSALLLSRRADGRGGVVQTLLILPTMMTPVVVGIVWSLLYNPDLGFLNYVMSLMGIPPQNWLGGLRTALPAVLAADVGGGTPFGGLGPLGGAGGGR